MNKGFSLIDIILVIVILGVLGYFAIQGYFKWTESFQCSEAISQLKKVKNQIEMCLLSNSRSNNPNSCILSSTVQKNNTPHFKCCEGENYSTTDNKISYSLYAIRNDQDLMVTDEGGVVSACPSDGKPKYKSKSGVIICREFDGTFSIKGWGIYAGEYGL